MSSNQTLAEAAPPDKLGAFCTVRSYLCRVLRLTLLAPDIVEAVLEGRQVEAVTLPALMKGFRWTGRSNHSKSRRGGAMENLANSPSLR